MKRLTIILAALLMVPLVRAQQGNFTKVTSQQFVVQPAGAPTAAGSLAASPAQPGTSTIYGWIVSTNSAGSVLAGPWVFAGMPTPSSTVPIEFTWQPSADASSYALLITSSLTPPTGACGCQINSGSTGLTYFKWTGGYQAYTVPVLMESQSISNGGNSADVPILEHVAYANGFAGSDIGAKVNAAIAALGSAGGEIVIPAGVWSGSTPIVLPRYDSLRGQGGASFQDGTSPAGTTLEYTGAGCAVIVGDTLGASGTPARLGASIMQSLTLVGNSGGSIVAGRYGVCLGTDPNADGTYWASLGTLNAYNYRFRDIQITGFDHGIEWGSNAFNVGSSGLQINENNIGTTEVAGITNSNSNNWFTRTIWYGNTGGALVQPSGGDPQGAAISCVECDFEWNNNLSSTSTDASLAPPQVTGGMKCFDCHFEAWGGIAWQTTSAMDNPRVVAVGDFYGADSSAITNDPVAFDFSGAAAGEQVDISNLYLNTAHTIATGIDCHEAGANPTCRIADIPMAGGTFTTLVQTNGAWGGESQQQMASAIWQSGNPLDIGASSWGLRLDPQTQSGAAAAGPTLDLGAWNGASLLRWHLYNNGSGTLEAYLDGGGGEFACNCTLNFTTLQQAGESVQLAGANGSSRGTISISSATSGSHTFTAAYSAAPVCTAAPAGTTPPATALSYAVSSTTTAVTVTLGTSGTATFNWSCGPAVN